MRCVFCNLKLVRFADARVVTVKHERAVACLSIDACNARRAAAAKTAKADALR